MKKPRLERRVQETCQKLKYYIVIKRAVREVSVSTARELRCLIGGHTGQKDAVLAALAKLPQLASTDTAPVLQRMGLISDEVRPLPPRQGRRERSPCGLRNRWEGKDREGATADIYREDRSGRGQQIFFDSLLHEGAVRLVPSFPLEQSVGRDHDVKGSLPRCLARELRASTCLEHDETSSNRCKHCMI